MRRLLRDTETGNFFAKGNWTPDSEAAEAFPSTAALVGVASDLQQKSLEIVLQMGMTPSGDYDIHLPLSVSHRARPTA